MRQYLAHLKSLLIYVLLVFLAVPSWAEEKPLERIAFGACAHQGAAQPIWDAVYAARPDLFVFLGDNIYGDTDDMRLLRARYQQFSRQPGYQRLKATTPIVATWDDHDYGRNDAGAEFPHKSESKQIFLDFFEEPEDSPRRDRDGVYISYTLGPVGRRVQVILLDTRWNRTSIGRVDQAQANQRRFYGMGPYGPGPQENSTLLGENQWKWLEKELREPAELRLLCSSIPVLQEPTGWETWSNFPQEKQRLFELLDETRAEGVLLLVGDTHWAEFSRNDEALSYPLWELNSSGLTENWERTPPNLYRLGETYGQDNYGLVTVDWELPDPQVTLEVRAVDNDLLMQNTLRLSQLKLPGWFSER